MNEEELQPKSNQWAPDDEGAKKGELNPKRISEQEFAYAIDQLKIPNCKSPGRLAGGFMGQMVGYGNHTVPSSKFQVPSSKFKVTEFKVPKTRIILLRLRCRRSCWSC